MLQPVRHHVVCSCGRERDSDFTIVQCFTVTLSRIYAKFLCLCDISVVIIGYYMRLRHWNRFRHETYKDDHEGELPYIRKVGEEVVPSTASSSGLANSADADSKPFVYKYFKHIDTETHTVAKGVNKGKTYKAEVWACNLGDCALKTTAPSWKIVRGSNTPLFTHLKVNHEQEYKLAITHSKNSRVSLQFFCCIFSLPCCNNLFLAIFECLTTINYVRTLNMVHTSSLCGQSCLSLLPLTPALIVSTHLQSTHGFPCSQ